MNQSGNVAVPNIRGGIAISISAKDAAGCRPKAPRSVGNGENDVGERAG
jgi:hypothetical protein